MKILFLVSILFFAVSADAQTLKELLYSGKLKSDTGSVVKKTDDLSTKIDTSTRKPAEPVRISPPMATVPDSAASTATVAGSRTASADSTNYPALAPSEIRDVAAEAPAASAPRDNNRIWKDFVDSLSSTVNSEVLTSKKVKGGTYSVLIEYEIGLDGQITVNNVSSFPENSFLTQQVRERITLGAPQLTPLLNSYGKPRKAARKQTINFTK